MDRPRAKFKEGEPFWCATTASYDHEALADDSLHHPFFNISPMFDTGHWRCIAAVAPTRSAPLGSARESRRTSPDPPHHQGVHLFEYIHSAIQLRTFSLSRRRLGRGVRGRLHKPFHSPRAVGPFSRVLVYHPCTFKTDFQHNLFELKAGLKRPVEISLATLHTKTNTEGAYEYDCTARG